MRIPLFFSCLLSLAVLANSTSAYSQHKALTVLPPIPHNKQVEVFFENETSISKDFVDYYDLRLVKRGHLNSKEMVSFLKQEAQAKGVDAIIELKTWNESTERSTFLDLLMSEEGEEIPTTTIFYTVIEGRGVKYLENIDLAEFVKAGKVYADGNWIGEVQFLPNGEISETSATSDASEKLLETFYQFSESRLLREKKDWRTYRNEYGEVKKRKKYRMGDWLLERVNVRYDQKYPDRIKVIKVMQHLDEEAKVSKIRYLYDEESGLVGRSISGAVEMQQRYVFKGSQLVKIKLTYAGQEYDIELEYYSPEDLEDLFVKVE